MGFLTKLFGKGKKSSADDLVFYGSYDEGLKDVSAEKDEGLKDDLANDVIKGDKGSENIGKSNQPKAKKTVSAQKASANGELNNKEEKPKSEQAKAAAPKKKADDKGADMIAEKRATDKKPEAKRTETPTASKSASIDGKTKAKSAAPSAPNAKESKAVKRTTDGEEAAQDAVKASDIAAQTKAARSGRFDIKRSKDGRYVFNLYASNHMIIATSQVYSSSSAALNGIKSVIANAPTAPIEDQSLKKYTPLTYPKWEIYQDKGGQYRFRLCASNGSCVCHSQGYTAKSNCKGGIESIIKFAKDAEIDKSYLKKE